MTFTHVVVLEILVQIALTSRSTVGYLGIVKIKVLLFLCSAVPLYHSQGVQ